MICPSCQNRVRGGICDGCGAMVRAPSTVCTHTPGPTRRGVLVRRDVAFSAWIANCTTCDRVLEMPAPVAATEAA